MEIHVRTTLVEKMHKIFILRSSVLLSVIFIITLTAQVLQAQEPVEVKRSEEKVVIGGDVFYIHTVQKGQTLFSISRAYGVTEQDIAAANPNVVLEVIKPGQVLKIPVVTKAPELSENYFGLSKKDFIYHKVKSKETVYSLTRKYNISKEILYKFNPGTESGLQADQEIRIPKKRVLSKIEKLLPEQDDRFIYYELKPKDTLYSLSQKYGVSVADIINSNEELRWGPKSGQIIRIPKKPLALLDSLQLVRLDSLKLDSLKSAFRYSAKQCDSISQFFKKSTINVAVLLPFFSDYYEQMPKPEYGEDPDTTQPVEPVYAQDINKGRNILEFYEGALIAVDSLKKTGLNINLMVFDTKRDTNVVQQILSGFEYVKPDLMIGPVYPEELKIAANFALENKITIISPLSSSNVALEHNPYIYKVMPSMDDELYLSSEYLAQFYQQNIVLLHNEDTLGMKKIDKFRKDLFSHFSKDSTMNEAVYKEVLYNDTINNNLEQSLAPNRKNVVIVVSNDEAYVSDVLTNLNTDLKHYNITVIGLPSWQNFQKIKMEYFHDLEVTLYTPFYVDYSDTLTKKIIRKFRKLYRYEPYRKTSRGYIYGFLGYDVAWYFMRAVELYGSSCTNCIGNFHPHMLLSKYNYTTSDYDYGHENTSISFIQYQKNFKITKLNYRFKFTPDQLRISEKRDTIPISPPPPAGEMELP